MKYTSRPLSYALHRLTAHRAALPSLCVSVSALSEAFAKQFEAVTARWRGFQWWAFGNDVGYGGFGVAAGLVDRFWALWMVGLNFWRSGIDLD